MKLSTGKDFNPLFGIVGLSDDLSAIHEGAVQPITHIEKPEYADDDWAPDLTLEEAIEVTEIMISRWVQLKQKLMARVRTVRYDVNGQAFILDKEMLDKADAFEKNHPLTKASEAAIEEYKTNQFRYITPLPLLKKDNEFKLNEEMALDMFIERYTTKSLHTLKLGVKYAAVNLKDPFTFWEKMDEWIEYFPNTTPE